MSDPSSKSNVEFYRLKEVSNFCSLYDRAKSPSKTTPSFRWVWSRCTSALRIALCQNLSTPAIKIQLESSSQRGNTESLQVPNSIGNHGEAQEGRRGQAQQVSIIDGCKRSMTYAFLIEDGYRIRIFHVEFEGRSCMFCLTNYLFGICFVNLTGRTPRRSPSSKPRSLTTKAVETRMKSKRSRIR